MSRAMHTRLATVLGSVLAFVAFEWHWRRPKRHTAKPAASTTNSRPPEPTSAEWAAALLSAPMDEWREMERRALELSA